MIAITAYKSKDYRRTNLIVKAGNREQIIFLTLTGSKTVEGGRVVVGEKGKLRPKRLSTVPTVKNPLNGQHIWQLLHVRTIEERCMGWKKIKRDLRALLFASED